MRATLEISVRHPDSGLRAPVGAVVVVRPEEGRSIKLTIPLHGMERVTVPPGEVDIDATLPAGQRLSRTVVATEGSVVQVPFDVPASPHEAMRWLSLTREPSRRATARVRLQPAGPRSFKFFGSLSIRAHPADILLEVDARRGPASVHVVTDVEYPEGRVLHVRDDRYTDVLRGAGESGLAMLSLRADTLHDAARVCALPGPCNLSESDREVHVLLRPLAGDALPDVQVVPTSPALITVVGFLERSDQPSLAAMRDRLAGEAVERMHAKREDPIAAAVGLAILLRLGELTRVRGWSRNLWQWFQGLPDGAALHAAVMLREPMDTAEWKAELREAVLGASKTGAPLLTDSLRHLREAAAVLADIDDSDEVRACARWCDHLMRAMDPDSAFTTLTLAREQVSMVWGTTYGKDTAR